MHILLIFIDGIGLGADDADVNPFASAQTPTLNALAGNHRWLKSTGRQSSERAEFIPTDPRLGVAGRPQSGTGQAVIITGRNIPQAIGRHYGPKPDAQTRAILDEDNFFRTMVHHGKTAALVEAYPQQWHDVIESGKWIPASYQYAARAAGLRFMNADDVIAERGMTGDWLRDAWKRNLGMTNLPVLTSYEAGQLLVKVSRGHDFAFMAHWMTDIVGHRGPIEKGVELIERFDGVMAGVLGTWEDDEGLIVITSDHGNLEDVSHRRHTENDVPTVVIGSQRRAFAQRIRALTDLVPAMTAALLGSDDLESAG